MHADVVIVGGGIAGLSLAAFLGGRSDVVLLEAEPTLGYHATGRSAAMYTECYGSPTIRRLAQASKAYLVDNDLGAERPVLFVAPEGEPDAVLATYQEYRPAVPSLRMISATEAHDVCDALLTNQIAGGVLEPHAMELDVHGLETSYRSAALDTGVEILTDHPVRSMARHDGTWTVQAGDIEVTSPLVVNAAGAWGDVVAEMAAVRPLDLRPLKRSAFLVASRRDVDTWPLVVDTDERWYFRPEGPNVLGSAASEIPSEPVDARHDEIDVALGIERINEATDLGIRSIVTAWAGLRTFTPDRTPAVGFDPVVDGFFWLVGQGGYGIKTSPAIAEFAAGLILDGGVPARLGELGVTQQDLDPARFPS